MLGPLFLPTPSRVENWKGVSNGTVITVEGFSFLFEYLSSPSSRECYVNALWHCYKNLLLNIGMMKCWRPCIKVNTSWPSSPADGSGENTNISVSTSSLFSPGHRPGWIRKGGGPFHRSPHLQWGEDSSWIASRYLSGHKKGSCSSEPPHIDQGLYRDISTS